jgi:hypothetical protein
MFSNTEIVEIIGVLATLVGAIAVVLELKTYPVIRFLSLLVICGSIVALVWISSHGLFFASTSLIIKDARVKAIQEEAREEARREIEAKNEADRKEEEERVRQTEKQKTLEAEALRRAQKSILGTWKSSYGSAFTFNADGTVSSLGLNIYTYKFTDSSHVAITGFRGHGITNDFEVQLAGPDQYIRWHAVVMRRVSH